MIEWITMALQTITPKHRDLQRITIYVPYSLTLSSPGTDIRQSLGKAASGRWSDLDNPPPVQLWESRSIRPRVGCTRLREEWRTAEDWIGCLFPVIANEEGDC